MKSWDTSSASCAFLIKAWKYLQIAGAYRTKNKRGSLSKDQCVDSWSSLDLPSECVSDGFSLKWFPTMIPLAAGGATSQGNGKTAFRATVTLDWRTCLTDRQYRESSARRFSSTIDLERLDVNLVQKFCSCCWPYF